jgi:predicted TIM-barrel fold metal-dependent hydrolase
MPLRDNVIADSDLHVMEPPDLWQRYIAPEYQHAAPIGLSELTRDMRVRVKNHTLLRLGAVRPQVIDGRKTGWRDEHESVYADAEEHGWDAASTVRAMDLEGLDLAVMFPSRGLFVLGLDSAEHIGADGLEPAYASAIARAYNDWLADYCKEAPDRMFGAAMVAPHDVEGAVLEARRCVEELGFKAVFLAPGCVNNRPWHHPAYDPLWAEIQRLDVPLSFHGGGQTYLTPDFSLQPLDKLMLWHTFNQPLAIQFVTVSLCGGGVLERFPDLRCALLEGNCSWAPWLLDRLDEHFEWTGWYEGTDLTMKPSDYFRRQCFLGVECEEATAVHYLDWFGDDNIVFSTDYPHGDSQYPHALDTFDKLPFTDEAKAKIVGANWERLYKISLSKHAPRS